MPCRTEYSYFSAVSRLKIFFVYILRLQSKSSVLMLNIKTGCDQELNYQIKMYGI